MIIRQKNASFSLSKRWDLENETKKCTLFAPLKKVKQGGTKIVIFCVTQKLQVVPPKKVGHEWNKIKVFLEIALESLSKSSDVLSY